jgi:tRNA-2-methylthio-N6-dimethylallyladenosine synthase
VRERAEEKLYTRLGEIREMARETGRDPIVTVTGCVAQQEGEALLARNPGIIDLIVGTQRVRMLPMLLQQMAESRAFPAIDITTPYDEPSFPLGITRRADPVKAYVTIIEGCNDFCAFCVVPYTRGHERMRAKSEIVQEVREAAATGHREAQLLGQIVIHYQAPDDPACDFPGLLGGAVPASIHQVLSRILDTERPSSRRCGICPGVQLTCRCRAHACSA